MLLGKNLKILGLVSLGSALEFYDFTIYGLFSAFLGNNFFPSSIDQKVSSFIAILLVYGTGYIARPFGGLLFGNIADKLGRKFSFRITLLIMATSTCLVGFIPSYAQIGVFSPIILLLLRIIQGLSIGAELPISSVFIFEQLSLGKNIFYGATLFGLSNFGLLIGNVINYGLMHIFTVDSINQFGWRIPFVFGGLLGLIAIYLRKKLTETESFLQFKPIDTPWKTVFTDFFPEVAVSAMLSFSYGLCVNFGFVLLFAVLEHLFQVDSTLLSSLTLVSTMLFCVVDSIIGVTADVFKIKIKYLLILGVLQFALSFGLVIYSYSVKNYFLGFGAMLWLTIATSFFDSTVPNILPRLFPAQIRGSGVSISYSIGLGLAGMVTSLMSILIITKIMPIWTLLMLILFVHVVTLVWINYYNLEEVVA